MLDIAITIVAAFILWLVYEIKTAPLLEDELGNMMADNKNNLPDLEKDKK